MDLEAIVRKEIDVENWKDDAELAGRVLERLNNLHRVKIQEMLRFEGLIRAAGAEPIVEVIITWPELDPEPEPPPEPGP